MLCVPTNRVSDVVRVMFAVADGEQSQASSAGSAVRAGDGGGGDRDGRSLPGRFHHGLDLCECQDLHLYHGHLHPPHRHGAERTNSSLV